MIVDRTQMKWMAATAAIAVASLAAFAVHVVLSPNGPRGGSFMGLFFAQISDTVDSGWQWPPFLDQSTKDWTETVGTALADKGDAPGATGQWQQRLTSYAQDQGFTVK